MSTSKCPECGKETMKEFRPFCSKRCADLDLGKWFNESYQLPGNSEIPGEFIKNSDE